MNIEMANRLLEYRKNSGLSQEELADKLGISRQSVSKWERAEASPDTDNLIELAKIYGVSIDELLNNKVEKTSQSVTKNKEKKEIEFEEKTFKNELNEIVILKGDKFIVTNPKTDEEKEYDSSALYLKDKNNNKQPFDYNSIYKEEKESLDPTTRRLKDGIQGGMFGSATAAYITFCVLGLAEWGKFWLIFIVALFLISVVEAIAKKNYKDVSIVLLVTFIYLTIGVYLDIWHPTWLIFIAIPVYDMLIKLFDCYARVYYLDELGKEHCFEIPSKKKKIISLK